MPTKQSPINGRNQAISRHPDRHLVHPPGAVQHPLLQRRLLRRRLSENGGSMNVLIIGTGRQERLVLDADLLKDVVDELQVGADVGLVAFQVTEKLGDRGDAGTVVVPSPQ
jgi:hypothetical protein